MAGRDSPGFKVRITRDMDEWLEQQAKANCRSKTAEVEFRLSQARRYAEQNALQGEVPAARPNPQG